MAISMTAMGIMELMEKVDDQTIDSDYFYTNPDVIEIENSDKVCLGMTEIICLPVGSTLDF